jgi:hypothetical protein
MIPQFEASGNIVAIETMEGGVAFPWTLAARFSTITLVVGAMRGAIHLPRGIGPRLERGNGLPR